MRKKATEKIWRDESDTGNKNKVEGVVQKLLVFFGKNLNKIANLDQKTCKKKTMKEKLGKDSIISSLYKISKCKLSKVRQPKSCNNSRLRCWLCCCKDSKVVYSQVNCVWFCFRDCTQSFSLVHKKTVSLNFVELPWLNTEAVVDRRFSN